MSEMLQGYGFVTSHLTVAPVNVFLYRTVVSGSSLKIISDIMCGRRPGTSDCKRRRSLTDGSEVRREAFGRICPVFIYSLGANWGRLDVMVRVGIGQNFRN